MNRKAALALDFVQVTGDLGRSSFRSTEDQTPLEKVRECRKWGLGT